MREKRKERGEGMKRTSLVVVPQFPTRQHKWEWMLVRFYD
jgi:hypothetical protein